MKFIKRDEISAKILSLIEESNEYVILVSPYVKISKWYKLTQKIDEAIDRNIDLQFIVREDQSNFSTYEDLDSKKYKYSSVSNLHAKLYINEKYAIVTSMNLLLSSEINTKEIGYMTETVEEHHELLEYCERVLDVKIGSKENNAPEFDDIRDWVRYIRDSIAEKLEQKIRAYFAEEDSAFIIKTKSNTYTGHIVNEETNFFVIDGIVSCKEYETGQNLIVDLEKNTGLKINFHDGKDRQFSLVWGTLEMDLRSKYIDSMVDEEKSIIAEKIIKFVVEIDRFKNSLK